MFNKNTQTTNRLSDSYEQIERVSTDEIEQLIDDCLATNINLLIYGEAGSGKSTIIEAMTERYNIVQLGAASLCEEMINGIPVHNSATNSIDYDKPDWLRKIQANYKSDPTKPQILFIDELTLARPEVMNSLQLLLTARAVPTHPSDILPDNVVIVSATNTVQETTEGSELSRPLKTRFLTVRMVNTPDTYKSYVMTQLDGKMSDLIKLLGEDTVKQFVSDSIKDFSEHWCDDTKFYGTNPRTIMNYFKMCNQRAKVSGEFYFTDAQRIAKVTTGHTVSTCNWQINKTTVENDNSNNTKATVAAIIPSDEEINKANDYELRMMVETIRRTPKARTTKYLEAQAKIYNQLSELERLRKLENKESK